jgi:asparagine synthase (glutamine-hydrolysing)
VGSLAAVILRATTPQPATVRRMLAAAPHRGTEIDLLSVGRAVLGVSSARGSADAWLAERDGLAAAVVGRIDNATELAKRFLEQDSRGSASPADVVLSAFRELGDRAPAEMRGIYSVVVSDGDRVWCFRDHLAFGALLYRQERGALYVASEAKQVLAGAGLPRRPDVETVERWFYGDVDAGETPCALLGVRRPARATILASDGERTRRRRYWDPDASFETGTYSEDELRERFDALMTQAVERTMTGNDVVSLSGGIDSPAVAAYGAARHIELSGRPIGALSMVFPDFPAADESAYIEMVARRLGLELHTFQPTARPLDDIATWVQLCDSPAPIHPPAEAAEYYRLARRLGYSNVIGGELAEFLIAERAALLSHLVSRGRLRTVPAVIRSQRDIGISWLGIGRQLVSPLVPRSVLAARQRRLRWTPEQGLPRWVDRRAMNEANATFTQPPLRRYRWEQTGFFVGPPIGTESDETVQAACGVRNRRPWVDVDLAEFFISLPAEVKFPDFRFKTLARRLLRGRVPDEILNRMDKTYFNERMLGTVDWDTLRRWLVGSPVRVSGIDYRALAEEIDRREFTIADLKWATDLAKTHAFLAQWA